MAEPAKQSEEPEAAIEPTSERELLAAIAEVLPITLKVFLKVNRGKIDEDTLQREAAFLTSRFFAHAGYPPNEVRDWSHAKNFVRPLLFDHAVKPNLLPKLG